jgi:hypothetical protein
MMSGPRVACAPRSIFRDRQMATEAGRRPWCLKRDGRMSTYGVAGIGKDGGLAR